LGRYETPVQAAAAYNVAAKILFKGHARLNEIPADEAPTPERVKKIERRVLAKVASFGFAVPAQPEPTDHPNADLPDQVENDPVPSPDDQTQPSTENRTPAVDDDAE